MAYLTQKKALQKGRTRKLFFSRNCWRVHCDLFLCIGIHHKFCLVIITIIVTQPVLEWKKNIIINIAVAVVVCYWFMHILINSAWNYVVNCYHTKMFEKNGDAFYGKSYFSSKV